MQIILEGMGRALHTNFNARFRCDALKVWFYCANYDEIITIYLVKLVDMLLFF